MKYTPYLLTTFAALLAIGDAAAQTVNPVTNPRAARVMRDMTDLPGMASGDLETDRARLEQMRRRNELELIQARIRAHEQAERDRNTQRSTSGVCNLNDPAPVA